MKMVMKMMVLLIVWMATVKMKMMVKICGSKTTVGDDKFEILRASILAKDDNEDDVEVLWI